MPLSFGGLSVLHPHPSLRRSISLQTPPTKIFFATGLTHQLHPSPPPHLTRIHSSRNASPHPPHSPPPHLHRHRNHTSFLALLGLFSLAPNRRCGSWTDPARLLYIHPGFCGDLRPHCACGDGRKYARSGCGGYGDAWDDGSCGARLEDRERCAFWYKSEATLARRRRARERWSVCKGVR